MTPTYSEIMALTNAMMEESTITKRREAARRLEQKLSSPRFRAKIVKEASECQEGGYRDALAELWKLIIQKVVLAVDKVRNSRSKLAHADLQTCFSIIKICDIPDESVVPEEARIRGTFRLGRKEVRMVLTFCLELLDDEDVLDVAELDVLDMMAYVTGSHGYISHLKSQTEMRGILEVVESRIADQALSLDIRQKSGEIFYNLCSTSEELGIEMSQWVAGGVKMVAEWCARAYRDSHNDGGSERMPFSEMSPLLAGITCIIRSNVEYSIQPLTRHGRAILRLTKSRYRRVADRTQRHVLNEYFLAHILAAQAAAALRGFLPGDLGDMGEASLTPRLVNDLLQLAMNRQSEAQNQLSGDLLVDEIQQTQLELTAQLLSCAQRMSLSKLEREKMGADPTSILLNMVDDIPKTEHLLRHHCFDSDYGVGPTAVVSHAPFMKSILKGLHDESRTLLSNRPVTQNAEQNGELNLTPTLQELQHSFLASKGERTPLPSTKTLLQILAACAEAFPAGGCWASQTMSCWAVIPTEEKRLGEGKYHTNRFVHRCDVSDLATVVAVVADVLDAHGDHLGSVDCQEWALRCLIRLAKSTSCLLLLLGSSKQEFSPLADAWQSVWSVLFRSDLRYVAYTANTVPNSVAELVLWTLSAITQNVCTDPSTHWSEDLRKRRSTFLYQQQHDVWRLPVFSLVNETKSLAPFEIILSMLHTVGLSEGSDSITQGLRFKAVEIKAIPAKNRRQRLINFCLFHLSSIEDTVALGVAATSIAALVNGRDSEWNQSLNKACGELTPLTISGQRHDPEHNDHAIFDFLWDAPKSFLPTNEFDPLIAGGSAECSILLNQYVRSMEAASLSADMMAESQSSELFVSLASVLDIASAKLPSEIGENCPELQEFIARLKVNLSVLLTRSKSALLKKSFYQLAPSIAELLKSVTENPSILITKHPKVFLEVWRVVEFTSIVASSHLLDMPHSIIDQAQDLAAELEKFLKEHCTNDGPPVFDDNEEAAPVATVFDLDNDDFEDRFEVRSRKRAKAQSPGSSRKKRRGMVVSRSSSSHLLNAARLLNALKPSVRTVKFIVENLLGVDLERPMEYYDSSLPVDPVMAASLTQFVIPILRAQETGKNTSGGLLARLVRMARRRSTISSDLHLFGFKECARFCEDDGWKTLCDNSPSDAKELLLAWSAFDPTELRSMALRPMMRQLTSSSLTRAFIGGDETLRGQWEKEYPKLLLPHLYDTSGSVRQATSFGVAKSLPFFVSSQSRVIASTLRNLPPVAGDITEFSKWYKALNGEINIRAKQAYEDARGSFETTTLVSMALLGGCVKEESSQVSMLFRFIEVAAVRPDLETSCLLLCDIFAEVAGFKTAEGMISECLESLIDMWLEKSETEDLLDVPLLLSAPSILRFLTKMNCAEHSDESRVELDRVRSHASSEFFERNWRLVLPSLFLQLSDPAKPDERLQTLFSIFEGEYEENMRKFLSDGAMLASMISCSYVMKCTSEGRSKDTSMKIADYLPEEDQALVRRGNRSPSIAAKRFLHQTSFEPREEFDSLCVCFARQFLELCTAYGNPEETDPFHQVGLTFSECCILSRLWWKSSVGWLEQKKTQYIRLVWTIVWMGIEKSRSEMRLDFLFLLFSETCSSGRSNGFLLGFLDLLKDILKKLTQPAAPSMAKNDRNSKDEVRVLFDSLTRLFKDLRKKLLNKCDGISQGRDRLKRRSCGLAHDHRKDQVGSPRYLEDDMDDMDRSSHDDIKKLPDLETQQTITILQRIVAVMDIIAENCDVFNIKYAEDIHSLATSMNISEEEKQRLSSLGQVIPDFQLTNVHQGIGDGIPDLCRRLSSVQPFSLVAARRPTMELSPHQHLLLRDLNDAFRCLSGNKYDFDLDDFSQELLLHRLSELCVGTPDDIRRAATRCIGALRHHEKNNNRSLASTYEESAYQGDRLEPYLRTKCLALLLDMVKSPSEISAVIAMETIKALLSTKNSLNRRELALVHFCAVDNPRSKNNSLVMDSNDVKRIKAAFDSNVTWIEWCWDPSFWVTCFESDFEHWICTLVPAIIACHFTDKSKDGKNKENALFLANCQRMSHMESEFAVAVFPLLIYHLLQEMVGGGDSTVDDSSLTEVQRDTWIGQPDSPVMKKISKCFATVLEGCVEQKQLIDSRAVLLLVDTLDMIRRLEQQRFRSSNGHMKNPTSLKAFRSSTPSSQDSAESQSITELQTITWCGLPFGVGMYLDGLCLAEACLKAKRYLSSIFYAEHFADVRFGGSTSDIGILLEELSRDTEHGNCLSRDISGFNRGLRPTSNEPVLLINDAIKCFEILVEATRALEQQDQMEALSAKLSDIRLLSSKYSVYSGDRWSHFSPEETLLEVDMAMSQSSGQAQIVALGCLSDLHLHNTLQATIEGLASRPENDVEFGSTLRDKWFEGCLFGNSLDSPSGNTYNSTQSLSSASGQVAAGFCESVFTALESFTVDDYNIARVHIENARFSTLSEVEDIITEKSACSDVIDKLSCLNDLECAIKQQESGEFPALKWKRSETPGMIVEKSFAHHHYQPEHPFSDRVQELILRHLATQQNEHSTGATRILSSFLWQRAEEARETPPMQTALRQLFSMHGADSARHEFFQVRHLQARIDQSKGDFTGAIRQASQSLERLTRFPIQRHHHETRAELLVSTGRWMAQYRVDSGEKILHEYLGPGMKLAKEIFSGSAREKVAAWRLTEACIALGDLVFSIYETVRERIKSPAWKEQGVSLRARERELKEVSAVATQQLKQKKKDGTTMDPWLKEVAMYRQNLSKDVVKTQREREKIERSRNDYKQVALNTLIQLLAVADDSYNFMSKFVYRMVALWLSSGEIVDYAGMDAIPSYRFVALSTQLFSRLTPPGTPLIRLVTRLVADHPYHCLAEMVRLAGSSENSSGHERDEEKASVANDILNKVKSDSPDFLLSLVENYEMLIKSYIVLAEAKTDDLSRGNKKIDFHVALKNQSQRVRLDKCIRSNPCPPCVLTKPPQVRPKADYGNGTDDPVGGERIHSFESNFSIAESGITRPKIVKCIGTRGGRFKQLVKGGDDVRGDSVMQQVFHYVNEIFAQEKKARARELRIVTYNIIPTSATSGVLEWVENTLPLGDYLVDRGAKKGASVGAHSRYFPGEWSASLCREQLRRAAPDRDKQKETMETIYRLHSPVFRFFFVERFGHSANLWFAAKSRYTRSVAVSSFVGHVLGIGDRHSNNILVHQGTGEVVHIDFGIVFEQGKLLQIPERVPFRLTRNVVDGFGPTKTDGSFTTASYETMNALRQNSGALLTILSSIVADPLYKWSISTSPKLMRKRKELLGKVQKGSAGEQKTSPEKTTAAEKDGIDINESAEQAVRKVREKLNGYEDGTAGEQQSTEGQVHFLINAARDIEFLSQMYPGWAPFA